MASPRCADPIPTRIDRARALIIAHHGLKSREVMDVYSSSGWSEPSDAPQPARRRGLWGAWLRLSGPPGDPNDPLLPLGIRERLRRGRLASTIIVGLIALDLLLLPTVLDDMPSTIAVLGVLVTCLLAVALNRAGQVTLAGYTLVLIIAGAVAMVFLSAPHGVAGLDYFPIYDLLVVPLVVGASLLPEGQVFVIAAINCAFILTDALLQPHGFNINTSDGYSLIAKPIIIQIIIAIVSFLWVRSTNAALRRADRAEELAQMEHHLAEQKNQMELGIREILNTHVRIANGDFGARAPLTQDNVLFQIAASLNNLLNRLSRAGQAEFLYQRTVTEIKRLRDSLLAARAGRQPLWPAPSGTPVDALIEVIAGPQQRSGASAHLPPADPYGRSAAGSYPPAGPGGWPASGPITPPTPSGPFGAPTDPWMVPGGTPAGATPDPMGGTAPLATPEENPWEMPPLPDWMHHEDEQR
jgi:hypothetical protein